MRSLKHLRQFNRHRVWSVLHSKLLSTMSCQDPSNFPKIKKRHSVCLWFRHISILGHPVALPADPMTGPQRGLLTGMCRISKALEVNEQPSSNRSFFNRRERLCKTSERSASQQILDFSRILRQDTAILAASNSACAKLKHLNREMPG